MAEKLTIQDFINCFGSISTYKYPKIKEIKEIKELDNFNFYKDFFIKRMDDKDFIQYFLPKLKTDFYSTELQFLTWIETGNKDSKGAFWLFPVIFYKDNDLARMIKSIISLITFRKEIIELYNARSSDKIVKEIKVGILGDYSKEFEGLSGAIHDERALFTMRRQAQIIKDNITEMPNVEVEVENVSHQYESEVNKFDIFILPNGFIGNLLYRAWISTGYIKRHASLVFHNESRLPLYLGKSIKDPKNTLEEEFAKASYGLKKDMLMKCALIVTNQVDACIRALSGLVQEARLPKPIMINLSTGTDTYPEAYPEGVKKQILKVIKSKGCGFLCVSIVDLFLNRTIDLIQYLKKETGLPVIVGGIHAELYPEQTIGIEGVDAICVGEAYKSFIEVLKNWDERFELDIPDFWFKRRGGTIKKNGLTPLYHGDAFKSVPFPDYSYVNYHLLDGDKLKDITDTPDAGPFRVEQHQIGHEGSVIYSSMGGCSNHCSFCNLTAQVKRRKDGGEVNVRSFRQKPLSMVKVELEALARYNRNMKFLCVMENDFTCRSEKDTREYCELISSICNVPFYTMVAPNTLNETKLRHMIDNGLKEINMGIQTNQEFNNKYYDRQIADEKILETVKMINKYSGRVYPFFDFINFNPEEPDDSILKTIGLVRQFPPPFDFVIHHLTLGDELLLYKRLINEKRIPGEEVKKTNLSDYHNLNFNDYKEWPTFYLNLLLEWIAGPHNKDQAGRLPRKIEKLKETDFGKKIFTNEKIGKIRVESDDDVLDLFTGNFFKALNAKENRDLLKELNETLPPVRYTNQQGVTA